MLTQNDAAPKLWKVAETVQAVACLPRMTLLQNSGGWHHQHFGVACLPRMTLLQNIPLMFTAHIFGCVLTQNDAAPKPSSGIPSGVGVACLPRMTLLQNHSSSRSTSRRVACLPRMTLLQNVLTVNLPARLLRAYPE